MIDWKMLEHVWQCDVVVRVRRAQPWLTANDCDLLLQDMRIAVWKSEAETAASRLRSLAGFLFRAAVRQALKWRHRARRNTCSSLPSAEACGVTSDRGAAQL